MIPKDGDISVCAYCAAILVFDSTCVGGFRFITLEELEDFKAKQPEDYRQMIAYNQYYYAMKLKPGDHVSFPEM